jgi:hypothetical protein
MDNGIGKCKMQLSLIFFENYLPLRNPSAFSKLEILKF